LLGRRATSRRHRRLLDPGRASARGVSVNKLVEELATVALAQADAENRYVLRKARGKPPVGLKLLDQLDRKSK
jgi:hypothetical protein